MKWVLIAAAVFITVHAVFPESHRLKVTEPVRWRVLKLTYISFPHRLKSQKCGQLLLKWVTPSSYLCHRNTFPVLFEISLYRMPYRPCLPKIELCWRNCLNDPISSYLLPVSHPLFLFNSFSLCRWVYGWCRFTEWLSRWWQQSSQRNGSVHRLQTDDRELTINDLMDRSISVCQCVKLGVLYKYVSSWFDKDQTHHHTSASSADKTHL